MFYFFLTEGLSCSRRNSHSVTSNSSEPNSPPDSPFGSQGQINCVNSQGHGKMTLAIIYWEFIIVIIFQKTLYFPVITLMFCI